MLSHPRQPKVEQQNLSVFHYSSYKAQISLLWLEGSDIKPQHFNS